jgi:hypothetical protein
MNYCGSILHGSIRKMTLSQLILRYCGLHVMPKMLVSIKNVVIDRNITIIPEQAHSVSMIRHTMDVVHTATNKLNSGQVPVVAFDQPLYALATLTHWNWPEHYGKSKIVIMFGGLHTEVAALKTSSSFLEGSGWCEAVTKAGLMAHGSAEALLSASHVRRCRRMHEITLLPLHILEHIAFNKYKADGGSDVTLDSWCERQCRTYHQFAYWTCVKKLQMAVLLFVRALRE